MSNLRGLLTGASAMGSRIGALDWSISALGPPDTWPGPLRMSVSIMLGSAFPMFVAWGPELSFIYNDAYAEILGGKHPGALGQPFRAVWAEIWQDISPLVDRAMAGEATFVEDLPLRMKRKGFEEDTRFTFSYSPVRDEDGTVTGMFCACTETTRKVAAEQALRELNTTLESQVAERTRERDRVWHNSRDLLAIIGADGTFRATNPAWMAVLGYEREDLVGRSFLDFIWADDAALTQAGLEKAFGDDDLTNFENRYRHRDGTPRWISWHTSLEGDLVYAYGRHITAEKEQAQALAATAEALRQAQKLEAIGQLTGGVAHDFNNLLTIIRSSVDFLRRGDLPEERRRRYIEAVSDTVDRAAKLTGQLLAFARRQALKPETFDVGLRLRDAADMLDTIMGARISVQIEMPETSCYVRADLSQFETALVNMAVNARDAMGGAGTLTLRLASDRPMPSIRGQAGHAGPFVVVSLADTGSGIEEHVLSHIFEPFFTTKDVGRGTGLGLSQVFGFVKQSGGDIAVESAIGLGTTFSLYLPQVMAAADEVGNGVACEDVKSAPRGAGRRVLVVEDNLEVGHFATQMLQDLGYVTTWATNADEALARLGESPAGFDVVFSDVVMPGMNGVELGREIHHRHPGLPVVLASGYSDVLVQEGRHGFELLQKPYSVEQLSCVLREVTRRHPAPAGAD